MAVLCAFAHGETLDGPRGPGLTTMRERVAHPKKARGRGGRNGLYIKHRNGRKVKGGLRKRSWLGKVGNRRMVRTETSETTACRDLFRSRKNDTDQTSHEPPRRRRSSALRRGSGRAIRRGQRPLPNQNAHPRALLSQPAAVVDPRHRDAASAGRVGRRF